MKSVLSSGLLQSISGLSLWFMAIFTIVFACGAVYGAGYMRHYRGRPLRNTLHWINYAVAYASMMLLCVVQNSITFLVCWEIMALSSFFLVIYESEKPETINAGINFFIQSHISVVLLTAGFMMIAAKTGSYEFAAIPRYCAENNTQRATAIWGMMRHCLTAGGYFGKE